MSTGIKKKDARPLIKLGGEWGGHIPPNDQDLEQAVLGAAMLEKDCQEMLFDIIQTADVFYNPFHQNVYEAFYALRNAGSPVDLLTVLDQMRKANTLDLPGQNNGAYLLTKMTMAVLSSAHVEAHARLLIEKYIKREQIRVGAVMVKNGFDNTMDAFDALNEAEVRLFELANGGMLTKTQRTDRAMDELMKSILEHREKKIEFTGVNTGFPSLNTITGGWQKSNMIILAARPSVGKSANIVNMAYYSAIDKKYGGPVGIFSLEMKQKEILQRFLSLMTGVLFDKVKNPDKLTDEELKIVLQAAHDFKKLRIYIDDTSGLTLAQLRTKARNLVLKFEVKSLYIDYLQLMQGDGSTGGNREQEVSKISRGVKMLAGELDIPIVALSQMTRTVDTQNRAPTLSDLRESGALEQDADIVLFLYRPTKDELDKKPQLRGKVLGLVGKNRNGATGGVVVYNAMNHIQKWTEYDASEPVILTSTAFEQVKNAYQAPSANTNTNNSFSFGATGTDGPVDDLPF